MRCSVRESWHKGLTLVGDGRLPHTYTGIERSEPASKGHETRQRPLIKVETRTVKKPR